MKYILNNNLIFRKENFDRLKYYAYNYRTKKVIELSAEGIKLLKMFGKPNTIKSVIATTGSGKVSADNKEKFIKLMIEESCLAKYE
jgi:hypothetical protein